MPRHATLPMDNGLGHHPAQHTRSRLTRGEGGQLRTKSPGEMGWVRFGGTVTELGRAAIADGRWPLSTRVDSVKLLAEIDSYAKKTTKTTCLKKSSVTSFKGALKAIDKKYHCLKEHAPAASQAQARIEAEFIVARRGFATLPPVAALINDRPVDAHLSLPDYSYSTLRLIEVTMNRIAQSRRPQFKAARRSFEAMDALLEMAAGE